jgi:prepilin-type N-terminal cleavage/methylation domain-containing protein
MARFGTLGNRTGFSLIELLAVIGILAIVAVAALSGLGMVNAHRLTTGATEVKAALESARQRAIARGSPVEVLFYPTESNGGDFDSFRVRVTEGSDYREGRLQRLPYGLAIRKSAVASPLLEAVPSVTDSRGQTAKMVRFLGDGSLEGLRTGPPLGLSIVEKNASVTANDLPANFAVLGLDPLLGTIALYRP